MISLSDVDFTGFVRGAIAFFASAKNQFLAGVGELLSNPFAWFYNHALMLILTSVALIIFIVLLQIIRRLNVKLERSQKREENWKDIVRDLRKKAGELERLKAEFSELQAKFRQVNEMNAKLMAVEEGKQRRLNKAVATAFEKHFSQNVVTQSQEESGNTSVVKAAEADPIYSKNGFDSDDITHLKEMVTKLGAKITIGPEDGGRELAQNISDMLIPGMVKAIKDVMQQNVSAGGSQAAAVDVQFKELVDKLKKIASTLGLRVIVVSSDMPEETIKRLADRNIATLKNELEKQLASAGTKIVFARK